MNVVVAEGRLERLRLMAQDWNVPGWRQLTPGRLRRAIAVAYERELRDEWRARAAAKARERAA